MDNPRAVRIHSRRTSPGASLRTTFPVTGAALVILLALARPAGAQDRVRVVVRFHDTAAFDRFTDDFVGDSRTTSGNAPTYHRREVVGAAQRLERRHGFRATNFYSHAIKGFAAELTRAQLRIVESDPLVESVEIEHVIALDPIAPALDSSQIVAWGIPTIGADVNSTQAGNGEGAVNTPPIYIVDTGIDLTHPDLNVIDHMSFVSGPNTDCYGHGTGVAGIAAARDNDIYTVGVAPGAPLVGVKVFTCAGITLPSIVIQALDWLTATAVKPAVVNLSLGSAIPLAASNAAARNAAASGLLLAIAAGNGNPFTGEPMNACLTSPAAAGFLFGIPNGIITTAATDIEDAEGSFSNYGECVDIWAPGVALTSTWLMSEGGTITASGTSFASPYVAGAAALLLSHAPTLTPPLIERIIQATATTTGTLSRDGRAIRRLSVVQY